MVERELPKLRTRVQSPLPAPIKPRIYGVLSCVPNKKINLYKTNYRCKIYVIKNTNYKILVKLIKYKIMVEIYKLKMYKNRYIK